MENAKVKPARDCAPAGFEKTQCKFDCSDSAPKVQAWEKIRFDFGVAIWRTSFALEESRQHHAALGNFWREAGFCVLLALMKIARLA